MFKRIAIVGAIAAFVVALGPALPAGAIPPDLAVAISETGH